MLPQNIDILLDILLDGLNLNQMNFSKFLLDCSTFPEVIVALQKYGPDIHTDLFSVIRVWAYMFFTEI